MKTKKVKTVEEMTNNMFDKIFIKKTYLPLNTKEIERTNKKEESNRITNLITFIILSFVGSLTIFTACIGTIN